MQPIPIQNARGRRSDRPMSDEERRAMFWRMGHGGGGGGGGGGGSSSPAAAQAAPAAKPPTSGGGNTATDPTGAYGPGWAPAGADASTGTWAAIKSAFRGFGEGALGGATILTSGMTFGLTDTLGLTDSDQYQGGDYDFSRGATNVAVGAITTALTAGATSQLASAWAASKFSTTIAGQLLGKAAPTLTAIGGFTAKDQIEGYIYRNPTMNPIAEKALSMAADFTGYVGAMGLMGSASQIIGGLASRIPVSNKLTKGALDKLQTVFTSAKDQFGESALRTLTKSGKLSLAGAFKTALAGIDKTLGKLGASVAAKATKLAPKAMDKLAMAYKTYVKFANFTGSTSKELQHGLTGIKKVLQANALKKAAADKLNKVAAAKIATGAKLARFNIKAAQQLARAKAAAATGNKTLATRFARDSAKTTAKAMAVAKSVTPYVKTLRAQATELQREAAGLLRHAVPNIKKAAYVAGMATGTTYIEERGLGKLGEKLGFGKGIQNYEREARAAFEKGEAYNLPRDTARGRLEMLTAFIAGIQGNPIEKLTRGGWARQQAEAGAYRAKYRMIDEALARGDITPEQARREHENAIDDKPFNMAGRGIWDVASALSAYINWKVGDVQDRARRSTYETVDHVYDGDTIMTAESGAIRASRYNTPELKSVHGNPPEALGREAADFVKALVKPGQTIRVVADSHWQARQPAGANYGDEDALRPVASYETTRSKLGAALQHVPFARALVPMDDVGEKVMAAGLGALRYKELSGRTDKDWTYGALQDAAQAAGIGVFGPIGQADKAVKAWAGAEKSPQSTSTRGEQPMKEWGKTLGVGLMATGNTGVFGQMPASGGLIAQAWNAVLAGFGVAQFNEGAANAPPMKVLPVYTLSAKIKKQQRRTEFQARLAAIRASLAAAAAQ